MAIDIVQGGFLSYANNDITGNVGPHSRSTGTGVQVDVRVGVRGGTRVDVRVFVPCVLLCVVVIALAWLSLLIWGDRASWWYAALIGKSGFRAMTVLLLCAAAMGPLLAAMTVLSKSSVPKRSGREATAVIEFALLFPVAMAIILIMVQSALLMSSNLIVHYAAWCAARTAVVTIPAETNFESRNILDTSDSSGKIADIRQAAVYALLPVAGRSDYDYAGETFASVAASMFDDSDVGQSLKNRILTRYAYAQDSYNTIVEVWPSQWTADDIHDKQDGRLDGMVPRAFGARQLYGPCETITVQVLHRTVLAVPYANRIFGYEHPADDGRYVTDITATCSMVNRGWFDGVVKEYDTVNNPVLPH